jgi:putative ABC transport system ATP-binding protein
MPDVIACEHLVRSYRGPEGTVVAVNDVSLGVGSGELVALVGASGSGKTTLLGLLGGLDRPDSGRVFLDGLDVTAVDARAAMASRRKSIGFVFQAAGLVPLMTAQENVALALEVSGEGTERAQIVALDALEAVGLANRARHRTYELSGGEQLRVALARAIVKSPAVLLADEPTGQLDSETGSAMFALLLQVARSGTAVLMATHDEVFAEGADRALRLVDGVLSD